MITTIVALMLTLVLTVSHAEAECAWVLWVQGMGIGEILAHPVKAFESRKECEADRVRRQAEARAEGRTPGLLSCLPDTIDPRGPKGGGR